MMTVMSGRLGIIQLYIRHAFNIRNERLLNQKVEINMINTII